MTLWHGLKWTRVTALGFAAALSICAPAVAQTAPPVTGSLSLDTTASTELTFDVLSVTLAVLREGADAATVQTELVQAVDAALALARPAVRRGRLDVETGHLGLHPRHGPKGGAVVAWQGRAELRLHGSDMDAIAALAARVPSMNIARVQYALSREAREQAEAALSAEAIRRFRSKAQAATALFGYTSFEIREVRLNTSSPGAPGPAMARSAFAAHDAALPVEPGRAQVSVSVSGTVQMR